MVHTAPNARRYVRRTLFAQRVVVRGIGVQHGEHFS